MLRQMPVMGRGMQSDCQQTGQQSLSLQLRHQPKEAALLPMHLGGLEPRPELGMVSPEHSRTTLPLVQASKLKSVHRFMLLIYTHTHTYARTHQFSLSSQQFSKSSRHWRFRDWCQPHSWHIRPFTNSFFCLNRNLQFTEVQAWISRCCRTELRSISLQRDYRGTYRIRTGTRTLPKWGFHMLPWDQTRALDLLELGWVHLASGGTSQKEQGSLQTLASGIQPTPVLWEMPGTQSRGTWSKIKAVAFLHNQQ